MDEENKMLKPSKVAKLLDVTPATVRSWCRTGKLPGVKIANNTWRIRQSDFQNFLYPNQNPKNIQGGTHQ